MSLYVVIGAGPVGSATAELLAARGAQVRVITRRGIGPDHPLIERIAADATDATVLTQHCKGADVVFQCAQPPYHRWATDFPPLAAAALQAAEATGAALLSVGNLYGYGQVDGPISEGHPLRPNSVKGRVRAELWAEALAAHRAGRVRVAEVRGSDYLGAGAKSAFTMVALPAVLSGRRRSGRRAQLDRRHRHRPHPGRGRRRRKRVGPGMAHAGRSRTRPRAREPDACRNALGRRTFRRQRPRDARDALPVRSSVRARLVGRDRGLRYRADTDRGVLACHDHRAARGRSHICRLSRCRADRSDTCGAARRRVPPAAVANRRRGQRRLHGDSR